ncbi:MULTISPECIES: hypothetical protein [unclassified Brevundimonas]|uniref:hypothetical protein n=1 Tax=unclassified Brevundimonas TaxID=2622653 RepID=UPI0025BBF860|nr:MULTISPECIES: hypothetical protein [unclassified Brevundimonas]
MTRYTYSTCVSFGTDGEADYSEIDVTVSYAVLAGRPETPPAYSHGGLPAEDAEIDDIRVEQINGKPVVVGDALKVEAILSKFEDGDLDADLFAAASEEETCRREDAADARRDYH